MAPTAYLIDYPIVGSDAPSNTGKRHRPCRDGIICKRQRLTFMHLPKITEGIRTPVTKLPTNSICEADTPSHPMLPEANLPDDSTTHRTLVMNRRKELMDIVIRTLALVRRNYILQVRLDSLRLEANNFFQSVLNPSDNNNCQNNHDKTTCKKISNLIVSSSDDKTDNINNKKIINLQIADEVTQFNSPLINQVQSTCISSTDDSIKNFNNYCKLNNS